MKASEISSPVILKTSSGVNVNDSATKSQKPPFRPAQDDTKPPLQDPILRSDPIESEEPVLRLPPFTRAKSKSQLS